MSVILGFDTATDDTTVAAARDSEVLFSRSLQPGPDGRPAHATMLLPIVEEAASSAGGWEEVGRIAVGLGPGSFTGLRIGLATAKALASSLGLPLAGVGTLEALARGSAAGADGRPILATLDARRGEVFAALFEPSGETIWRPFVAAPDDLVARVSQLAQAPLAAGSGALRFRDELQVGGAEVPDDSDPSHRVAAEDICAIGAEAPAASPEDVPPIYLRQPDAERWRERDSKDK
jgi:tRNA threonylcarbamoyladenosine biosynthesis protein TsaB